MVHGFWTIKKFLHPNLIARIGICPEPSLFEEKFPESKDAIKRFARNGNLADLTAELLRDFIITNLLPGLLKSIAIHNEHKELLDFYKEKTAGNIQQFEDGWVNLDTNIAPGKSHSMYMATVERTSSLHYYYLAFIVLTISQVNGFFSKVLTVSQVNGFFSTRYRVKYE
jgi:hypothetical protein